MSGANVGYIRVSTVEQNSGRQLEDITLDKVFEDKVSGDGRERPGWNQCNAYLREGDTLYVHSIDRLARSLANLHTIVKELNERGVEVHFVKENMTFGKCEASAFQVLHFQILGAFAQFERALILERQREGIARAKAEGKYRGRKPSLSPSQIDEARNLLSNGASKAWVARHFGVSRVTIYDALARAGGQTAA